MNIEDLKNLAEAFPGVTTDIKWEHDLCFNVGGKMFLVTNPDKFPHPVSFKLTPELYDYWVEQDGVIPAPYLARYKWVQIDDIGRLSTQKWKELISISYEEVAKKLPKKVKNELGIAF